MDKSVESVSEPSLVAPTRKLAYIAIVDEISPTVQPSDNICIASIGFWKCVVPKGKYNVGEKVIYISIDSAIDISNPIFSSFGKEVERVKTRTFRGSESQGLVIDINNILLKYPEYDIEKLQVGDDVTDLLGVTKYILPEEELQYDATNGTSDIPKIKITNIIEPTDELRIQNCNKYLNSIRGKNIVITKKMDGCSCSFILHNEKFYIAGRNFIWNNPLDKNSAHYFAMATELNIEKKMIEKGVNMAIRGELIGPKISNGRTGIPKLTFMVFNIYDFGTRKYLNYAECMGICTEFKLMHVPVLYIGNIDDICSIEKYSFFDSHTKNSDAEYCKSLYTNFMTIAEMQDTWYTPKLRAEGIVVKTDVVGNRLSFKVISNKYLLKHKL